MKNIRFYLFCILIIMCFLLTTKFLDGIIYFPLYQIEKAIRTASGCFYTFIVMMRISSLLAVALASFCFGFITHFNCKLAGLSASLYLILDCLSLLHLLHLGLFEPIVVYIAFTYIPPPLAAYFVGSAPDWGKTKEALLLLEGALQGTFGRRTSLVPYWLMTNGSAISDSEWRRI